jgi:hypothetical protein
MLEIVLFNSHTVLALVKLSLKIYFLEIVYNADMVIS